MSRTRARATLAAVTAFSTALVIAGCSPASSEDSDGVTITVGGRPSVDRPEELAQFERLVEAFENLNPDITIESEEAQFDVNTFQAQLAGGQLPTTFSIPFTEMQGLIERGQVAEITAAFEESELLTSINETVLDIVSDGDGNVYGIPTNAYSMGVLYNRDLFTQAGLDPDQPPATWDEVREAARAIEDATDATGYTLMTTENTGGWSLTTMSYGFGDIVVSDDGREAQVDNDAAVAALEYLRDLRWDDNVMGSNFLVSYGDSLNQFAAGNLGMVLQGADAYDAVVVNLGMAPEALGIAPLPQSDEGIGTLGGGTAVIFDPTASEEELAAAVEWVEFSKFSRYTSEEEAVAWAKAASADGLAVGAPGLPLFDQERMDQYWEWIEDYINVPREQFAAYLDTAQTLPIVPEPAVKAQEIYATLDPVVQAVLTREDADIEQLLADANSQIQSIIAE